MLLGCKGLARVHAGPAQAKIFFLLFFSFFRDGIQAFHVLEKGGDIYLETEADTLQLCLLLCATRLLAKLILENLAAKFSI